MHNTKHIVKTTDLLPFRPREMANQVKDSFAAWLARRAAQGKPTTTIAPMSARKFAYGKQLARKG